MEKTVLLYNENRRGLLISLLIATMVCAVMAQQINLVVGVTWWAAATGVLLCRMILFFKFQSTRKLGVDNLDQWRRLFVFGAIVYGVVWGVAAAYFAHELDFQVMLLMVVVILSLCIGAIPYLFYSMTAIVGYLVTIMGPITIWLLLQPEWLYWVIGVVCSVFAVSNYLGAKKLNTLMTNAMRLQLENAELSNDLIKANYELKTLSSTDPLSGIANRRAFEKNFDKALLQCKRSKNGISLLMFDIDHFKRFNDTYGHLSGDKIIRLVAKISSEILKRPLDMVARYGGEEYIVVLPNTDLDGAKKVAEDIRQKISDADISEFSSPEERITISVGVTTAENIDSYTLQDFVSLADTALYQAKKSGRNRVETSLPKT